MVASAVPHADAVVVMGRILAPYGIRGWLKVRPFSESPDALLQHRRWLLRGPQAQTWREMQRLDGRMHSDTVLAELAGVDSREAASALRGAEIGVARSSLPAANDDEIYCADLVGLEVVNREGIVLGRVADVRDFGAHPLLRVIATAERPSELLIPFVVGAHVDRVDFATRRIEVDWQADY